MKRDRWDAKYRAIGSAAAGLPRSAVIDLVGILPSQGTAIDVAGGNGNTAIWLAEHGFQTTLCDLSAVALEQAVATAAKRGVALRVEHRDVEAAGIAGRWDLIVVSYFLHRPLLLALGDHLTIGGAVLFVQPTETNLERNDRPSRRFLLADGEVVQLSVEIARQAGASGIGLRTLHISEAWRDGTYEARLVMSRHR